MGWDGQTCRETTYQKGAPGVVRWPLQSSAMALGYSSNLLVGIQLGRNRSRPQPSTLQVVVVDGL
jgi:hypothetical protein